MPICPRCNATIHTGAREKCPACGYSLALLDRVFGNREVTFPRVRDAAGVLTQQERASLLRFLEKLESKIPPVALCIYLTDHGQSQEFRSHAHWILNHARIHSPSFGKREGNRAIEEAELREGRPESHDMPQEGGLGQWWNGLTGKWWDRFTPVAPPVRHEWMLILVIDVQLKMACFSWGYMLDPYINPDKINSCITAARLQFRERAKVAALQIVMKKAAAQLEAAGRRMNKTLSKQSRGRTPLPLLALGISLLAAAPVSEAATPRKTASQPARTAAKTPASAAKPVKPAPPPPAAVPEMQDDEVAEEVEEESTPAPAPAPAQDGPQQPVDLGAPAGYGNAPRWSSHDYKRLMAGELGTCYSSLLPAERVPAFKEPAKKGKDESDTSVPGRYCPEYAQPSPAGLADPQKLLSTMERADVEHVLRELNAHSPFRIYVAVFKAGQEIPQELNVSSLVTQVAGPGEYAAMILFSLGASPDVQLGYQEIQLNDEQQREWQQQARTVASRHGGGVEALLATVDKLHASISPLSSGFRPISEQAKNKMPLIDIRMKESGKEKEEHFRDKIRAFFSSPETQQSLLMLLGAVVASLPVFLWLFLRRRVVRLLDTTPDVRLASPYGAGVSRYVRYLDGKEATKEKSIL